LHLQETLEKINSKNCSIQVFGLGYVGFPLSIRLAKAGFKVIGVDTDLRKIQSLKNNSLSKTQVSLKKSFFEAIQNGNFVPSMVPIRTDLPRIGVICVPTPIPDGKNDSKIYVRSAVKKFLDTSKRGDVLILESSVKAGTTDEIIKTVSSRKYTIGKDFGVCFCPERIDPLNQKWKLENIPRVIFATDDTTYQIAQKIYQPVNNSSLFRVRTPEVAEIVKSFENTFRLVNISLVNELAILCDKMQINVNEVIDAVSTKPFGFMRFNSGAGAGGHCIPKDPTFLLDLATQNGFNFSSINNSVAINKNMPKYIVNSIEKTLNQLQLKKSVLVLGLAYKSDMDDMRDSPGFKICNELHQNNFVTAAYDPFFRHELLEKYLIENQLEKLDFKVISKLDENSIKGYDCICLAQHHTITKQLIEEIYKKSQIPLIYDCQNKINYNPKSKTILKGLGLSHHDMEHVLSSIHT